MRVQLVIISFLLSSFMPSRAQYPDSTLITELLKDIAAAQVIAHKEFIPGTFPSWRGCKGLPHNYQPDNNIFFTAISVFTLRNLAGELKGEDKSTAGNIIRNAQKAFPHYAGKDGCPYYSFWPRGRGILPHSLFIKKLKSINMGQDADDAVMCLMASDAPDSASSLLKKRMTEVSNLSRMKTNSTFRRYRDLPAYSTWLGYRMKPDFDFGVQCNILYFMLERKLPLVKEDSATIELLAGEMANRDYIKAPVFISPYYARPAVLMYHMARLMGRFPLPGLLPFKDQLVADLRAEWEKPGSLMDRIILSTSLLRLGAKPPDIEIPGIAAFEKFNLRQFVFFQARAAFSYPKTLKQIFLHWAYMTYYFYCPAYNKVLLLEYLIEKNKNRIP